MRVFKSLGAIAVAAAGTRQKVNATYLPATRITIMPFKIVGAAVVPNVGLIYIGDSTMDKTTGVGVFKILYPAQTDGTDITFGDFVDLSTWYIDADNTADGAIIGYQQ